jgi:ribokinase
MNQKTAIATILTNNEGENQVTVFHGANDDLDSLDLLLFEDVIKSCDCLLIQFEVPIQVVEKAIQIAKANHRFIIINPAPAVPNTLTLLQEADIITPNFNEAKTIFDLESDLSIEDFKKIINKKIKEYQIGQAIITLGKDGSLIVDRNQQIEIPAIKVNTIDTTGAGDVFNAALAVSLAKGIDLLNAAKFANKAAALSVTKRYVMPSLPYLSEIK